MRRSGVRSSSTPPKIFPTCLVLPTVHKRSLLADALTLVSSRCDLEHDHQKKEGHWGGSLAALRRQIRRPGCGMGDRNSIPDELRGEGHRLIAETYLRLRV